MRVKKECFVIVFSLCCLLSFADEIQLTDEDRQKSDSFFLEALRLKEKGEYAEAYTSLQQSLEIDSTSAAALFELAHYYLQQKKEMLALNALQKSVRYSPGNFEYKLMLADLSKRLQRQEEAIDLYEQLAQEYPAKPEIHFYLSELYIRSNQMDKAIQSLNDLENNMGVSEPVSMQKFQLYNLDGKEADALNEIANLIAKYPTEAKYPILTGDYFLEKGDTIQAMKWYKKAYQLDPNNPYYYISMANYYEYSGDEEAVAKEIDRALRNPSLEIGVKLEILEKYLQGILREKKNIENANKLLETIIEQHPQEKELNAIYGELLLFQNKTEEAKFQFQLVTEADPENLAVWRKLLNIALVEEQMDEVIEICNRALVYFPDASEFYYYKGSAYYQKKEYPEALKIFTEGLSSIPEENTKLLSSFYGQMGDLYYQMGEKEKAYQTYDKALEDKEMNILIMNNYAYFLSLDKKDLDKAERMSAKCGQLQPDNATYIDTYAWIFFQKGNYSLAKFYIESALSKTEDKSGDITDHYGDILFKIGNIEKAVSEWKKALLLKEINGENTTVLKRKIEEKRIVE
jgi:tetratricopeptide (TPR) repeat protein